jgi:hypothetical protein
MLEARQGFYVLKLCSFVSQNPYKGLWGWWLTSTEVTHMTQPARRPYSLSQPHKILLSFPKFPGFPEILIEGYQISCLFAPNSRNILTGISGKPNIFGKARTVLQGVTKEENRTILIS